MLLFFPWSVLAQTNPARPDTLVFSAQTFYEIIRNQHPLVKQADLFGESARQVLMQARGGFDPKLVSNYDRKEFGSDLYYNQWQNKLSVPVWLGGVDLFASYDRNDPRGKYFNPADRTPESGLAGLGVTVPIGQGLLIDARRNAVQQARLARTLAEADRLALINQTLFEAANSYWTWFLAHQQRRLLTEGSDLAYVRFVAVRQRALLGDVATIDTTEALITFQERLVMTQQATVEEQNARLQVSTFLWNADGAPVELPAQAVPQQPSLLPPPDSTLQALLDQAAQQHPELLRLDTEIRQLTLEERFRRAMIQPQIALTATLLSDGAVASGGPDRSSEYAFRTQNHKVGLDVVFPLFLRKERGKFREVQIKNQQTRLTRQQTGRDIVNTVQSTYNQLLALAQQVVLQQQTVRNQQTLVLAEQQKFDLGESTLFLVNTRETKLIELRVKGEELKANYQKAVAELYFAAGTSTNAVVD
ncbi:MAG: TolC family protein [Bacteroidetes bacterium]|nr:TolC family protein [Fibrella sp.]